MSIGVTQDNLCPICDFVPETVEHLLFNCTYSANCLILLQSWLNVKILMRNIWKYRRWNVSKLRKQVIIAAFSRLAYHIWKARNDVLWLNKVPTDAHTLQSVKQEIQNRLLVLQLKGTKLDTNWIHSL